MNGKPSFADVLAAEGRIREDINRTPVLTSSTLDEMTGAEIYLKCENFQKTGSFKYRGAVNAVRLLSDEEARKGVATHSSGNHAQALALAAKKRGVPAYLVMPEVAPASKRAAVEGYGAALRLCGPTTGDRMEALDRLVAETGAAFVHSSDDPRIIAGAGTAALELLRQTDGLDAIVAPVGGGGLLSGTLLAGHGLRPVLEIYGAEPEMADDAYRSLNKNSLHPARPPRTIADGLRTGLSELTFTILKERATGILRVSETEILAAMRLLWERTKILVEPSGAVSLAAVIREPDRFEGKRVGVILSGGNVDLNPENLARLLGKS